MNYLILIYFVVVCSLNIGIALLVLLNNPRRLVNRLFALCVLSVVLWTFSVFAGTGGGLLWKQLTFALATLTPPAFLAFAHVFPSAGAFPRNRTFLAVLVSASCLIVLSFTRLIVADVTYDRGHLQITYGPLYPVFAAYFLLVDSAACIILWRKSKTARGIERVRLHYLFVGAALAAAGGITTNLLIPLLFRTSALRLLGPSFMIFIWAFVAHAIIRYRLMDISLVLRRGATFVLSVAGSGLLILALSLATYSMLGEEVLGDAFIASILIGIFVAFTFPLILRLVQVSLDRYLRRAKYDPGDTLQHALRQLSSVLDLDLLSSALWQILSQTARPESLSVYVEDSGTFRRVFATSHSLESAHTPTASVVHESAAVPTELKRTEQELVREEVHLRSDRGSLVERLLMEMTSNNWELVLPLLTHRRLRGFIAVGPKLSSDPYFKYDLAFLTTLASQAAIVLANASLYAEVKNVKEHIEAILEHMESGVVVADSAGRIDTVNAVAEAMLGLNAASVRGKPIHVLPAPVKAALVSAIEQHDVIVQCEVEFYDHTGDRKDLVLGTSLLKTSTGEIGGAILVCSDHSQIKELERQQRRAERLAAFQSMATGIAHEIKNPLVAIKTFAELLPERFTDAEFRGDFAKVVSTEITRIAQLVDGLRGLAAPYHDHLPIVDIREPLEDTLTLLGPQLQQAGILVSRNYGLDRALVCGDKSQLMQLFINIFVNSLEAISAAGNISVHVRTRNVSGDHRVSVEIRDSGTGIPANLLGTVFDPFVTSKARGSGLGLSICRGIADAHRAKIWASNNIDAPGATVVIDFPLADAGLPSAAVDHDLSTA